ncbi:polysaccharide biosynthesis C-terminal domain-containing protein [Enterococcus faecium]|uniref:oligosaccharide flippase family protein n=1 Tax=Enterococcus TaxID=1350 RepID=UPI001EB97976|nr:polysaccharide biosynthesis C-terminal domain-containing protein [Enterococcus faecium]NTL86677.1 polysaccharide biosynthesis C-terminal domain-containing protein [Enterococcus faecium]WBU82796.1 polysaccharide biosynthesis C-terminal domain-containing protein [Enterococcus faecium]
MNKYKRLISNSLIFAVGNFGSKILLLLLVPFYTFQLTTSEYGTADLVTTTINMLLPIVTLSIYEATLRFTIGEDENRQYLTLKNSFLLLFLASIVFILAITIINLKIKIPYSEFIIIIIVLQGFQNILAQYVRAINKIKIYAINGIIMSLVLAISNIIFLKFLSFGVDGYLLSIIMSNLVSLFFMIIVLKFDFILIVKSKVDWELFKRMLVYSVPLIPNAFMWWLMNASSRYFILFYLDATANGLFAVASKIPSILSMVQTVFFQAWQLSAIEEYDSDNKREFYSSIFYWLSTIMIICTSILILFLKPIINITMSGNYSLSWKPVPFLLIGLIFSSFSSFFGTFYIAEKKTTGVMYTSVIGGMVSLILNFILIRYFGIIGAGLSTLISFLLIWILRVRDINKFFKINIQLKRLCISISGLILQVVFIFFINNIVLNVLLCFSLIVYEGIPLWQSVINLKKR